jgi:hypothetical protein
VLTGITNVGALAGALTDTSTRIIWSHSSATVTGTGSNVGGMAGSLLATAALDRVYVRGNVNGINNVGGLVGSSDTGLISNGYASGHVSGADYIGGLVGLNSAGTANRNFSTSHVKGANYVGGLVGSNTGSGALIEYSFSDGRVIGSGT